MSSSTLLPLFLVFSALTGSVPAHAKPAGGAAESDIKVPSAPATKLLAGDPQDKREAIRQTVAAMEGLDDAKRAKLTIQIALADYLVVHGRLPDRLEELVPTYFPKVPENPKTGTPFGYIRKGKKYSLFETSAAGSGQRTSGAVR